MNQKFDVTGQVSGTLGHFAQAGRSTVDGSRGTEVSRDGGVSGTLGHSWNGFVGVW